MEIDKDLELADEWAQNVSPWAQEGWRATCKRLANEVRRLRAELSAPRRHEPAVSVPDGWKLVPLEPTNEMMRAGFDVCGLDQVGWLELKYKAMLAAAPEAKP